MKSENLTELIEKVGEDDTRAKEAFRELKSLYALKEIERAKSQMHIPRLVLKIVDGLAAVLHTDLPLMEQPQLAYRDGEPKPETCALFFGTLRALDEKDYLLQVEPYEKLILIKDETLMFEGKQSSEIQWVLTKGYYLIHWNQQTAALVLE